MSKAVKCDRCGKCFDRFDKSLGAYIHIPEVYFLMASDEERKAPTFHSRYEDVDLCHDCSKWIETWLTLTVNNNTVKYRRNIYE